jgi:hypothetical protein
MKLITAKKPRLRKHRLKSNSTFQKKIRIKFKKKKTRAEIIEN